MTDVINSFGRRSEVIAPPRGFVDFECRPDLGTILGDMTRLSGIEREIRLADTVSQSMISLAPLNRSPMHDKTY